MKPKAFENFKRILKEWFDMYSAASLHGLRYTIELVKCYIYAVFKAAPSEEQDDEPY